MWYGADYDTLPLFGDIRVNNRLHIIGSTVHASMLVAKGAISAEIFPGSEHGHCDMAASVLIVREAGGKVTNLYGEDQRYDGPIQGAILSNGIIHDDILNHCKKYFKKN